MFKKQQNIIIIAVIISLALILIGFQTGVFNFQNEKEEKIKHPTTRPFLWRIEGENISYLYGSIHVADNLIVTLPDVVISKLSESDAVFTETKLDFQTKYEAGLFCELNNEKLEDLIPSDLENDLNKYLESKKLSLEDLNSLKPWSVAIFLDQLEYPQYFSQSDYKGGLDQYIWDLANNMGKETYGLENAYEQLSIFDNLTNEEQIQLLSDSLNEVIANNTNKNPYTELINSYLNSDLELYLESEYQSYDESDLLYEKLMTELLKDRNQIMTQRIIDNITKHPDKQFFFTIGAAHFYGEDNIITLLENQGYTVTEVPFLECSSCACDPGEEKINNRCYIPYSPP